MLLSFQPSPAIPTIPVRRFSVAEYHRMIATAVLAEDEPVELLEGWIIPKMPRDARHDATIELADDAVTALLPTGWRVRVQSAITLEDSEPEPDLVVVRGSPKSRTLAHPGPSDIELVIEVSGSSLAIDRRDKARVYARAHIKVYWIINLVDRVMEVHRRPAGGADPRYEDVQTYRIGDAIPLEVGGSLMGQISVEEIIAGTGLPDGV